jgi:alkylation response protein AidB-like acyl-CoA dehydrogenase
MVKPEYGGSGMDTISYVLAMEEISKVDASVSVCMSVTTASCAMAAGIWF